MIKNLLRFIPVLLTCLPLLASAAVPFTIYFSRHAEKIHSGNTDPALTIPGQKRASNLAVFMENRGIEAIYSTNYLRTQATARPTADLLRIDIEPYDPAELGDLGELLLERKQNALVVGHSNTTPVIVDLVGGEAEHIEESQYGDLFAVKVSKNGTSTTNYIIEP